MISKTPTLHRCSMFQSFCRQTPRGLRWRASSCRSEKTIVNIRRSRQCQWPLFVARCRIQLVCLLCANVEFVIPFFVSPHRLSSDPSAYRWGYRSWIFVRKCTSRNMFYRENRVPIVASVQREALLHRNKHVLSSALFWFVPPLQTLILPKPEACSDSQEV